MRITVSVKTKARHEKLERIDETHFVVWVHTPPIDGKANEVVSARIADHFKVAPSCVTIVSGHTAKQKILDVLL